ncbi:MAG: DNA polymerase III subunit beta [Candidatus Krumholzibacteriota bacterium]|nr:DNA polymerase III subunit beta [Candidatus Krumholzibacteriota bacterium]
MKVVIPLEELSKKMNAISGVVPAKTTMPILSMTLIKADTSGISFSATDLDISVTSKVNGKVDEEGLISVPAKKIAEIVKSLSQGEVTLSSNEENKLTIKCGKSRFSVNGRSAEDFPKLPKQESKAEFSIDSALLGKLVQKTLYAVSTDLTRPALCGVKWEIDKGGVLMVSTDGHRLAKAEVKLALGEIKKSEVIVPPKALSTFKAYAQKDEMIRVNIGDNSISFEMDEVSIYSRLLEGPFPNYQKVIPANNTREMLVSKEALSMATKRVSILSDALTHQVIFSLGKDNLRLHVTTQDLGEATEDIDATYSDEEMEIGYNAAYIQDILRTFDTDDIAFNLDRPDNAGIIKPVEQSGEIKQLCIVMPLRIL